MKLLSGLDARFLYSSTPTAHMHTLKAVIIDISGRDGTLDDDELAELIGAALDRMPILRRRIIRAPRGLGNPAVIDDPDFDICHHLRKRTLPAPGGRRELDHLIAEIISVPLPLERPLWELTIVDGIAADHIAFIMKIHHALADGMASVALLENAFLTTPGAADTEEYRPEPLPTRREHYRLISTGAAKAARTLPRVVAGTASGIRRSRTARRHESAALAAPFAGPRTTFNVALTPDRTFATVALDMDAVLRAKHDAGVTVNDVFLSICAGGIRRYLRRHATLPAKSLIASVPMATRTGRRHLHGNHLDNLILPVHTDEADPAVRARAIHESSAAGRRIREAFGTDLFELRAGLVPAALHGLMPRLWVRTGLSDHLRPPLNFIASNVRGPREPMELDGAVVTGLYSCGPILEGIGLNVTAWSYADALCVSVLGCSASLPEPDELTADIAAELDDWIATVAAPTDVASVTPATSP